MPMSEVSTRLRPASSRSSASTSTSVRPAGSASGLRRPDATGARRRRAARRASPHRARRACRPARPGRGRCGGGRTRRGPAGRAERWSTAATCGLLAGAGVRLCSPAVLRHLRASPTRSRPGGFPFGEAADRLLSSVASPDRSVGLRDSGEVAPSAPRAATWRRWALPTGVVSAARLAAARHRK